jgi:hypothetical protein
VRPTSCGFTVDDAVRYIDRARWQFAKTVPRWPHEYTIREWRPELDGDFERFASLIRQIGVVKAWPFGSTNPLYHHTYLTIGDFEYWTMGEPLSETTVINRAAVDLTTVGTEGQAPPRAS